VKQDQPRRSSWGQNEKMTGGRGMRATQLSLREGKKTPDLSSPRQKGNLSATSPEDDKVFLDGGVEEGAGEDCTN